MGKVLTVAGLTALAISGIDLHGPARLSGSALQLEWEIGVECEADEPDETGCEPPIYHWPGACSVYVTNWHAF